MTTPTDNTPNAIITDAMVDSGLLMLGEDPSGEQLAQNMRRLRDLINAWQTQGIKLWLNVDTAVTLVAGQATYSFKPSGDVNMVKPLRVIEGYYLYTTSQTRRPIYVMSWRDYLTLGQAGTIAANRGAITQYFVDKQQSELDVTFWLCPDTNEAANGTAHVLLQTQVTQFTGLTDTMNFPLEWRMALHWGLSDEICTGQPDSIVQRCAQRAMMYKGILEDWDVEDAPTQIQPDPRMNMGGRFR